MKYSVENRSPFLDVNLFEFAFSIPSEFLIMNGYGKFILREAVKGYLNNKLDLIKKVGFNASLSSILNINDPLIKNQLLKDSPVFELIKKIKLIKCYLAD